MMKRTTITLVCLILGIASLAPVALARGQSSVKEARQATAKFHKVSNAERAGYGSTLGVLGCFESEAGGMGLHYLNGSLLDDTIDASEPEALVYEMRENGDLKFVGLEYLIPEEFVTDPLNPPELFGQEFHPHPVLPFWILHAYIWRPNPSGMFEDFNPSVRMCPEGTPVFGAS